MNTTIPLLIAFAFAGSAFAGTKVVTTDKEYRPSEPECFRAHELQLDMFGQYSDGNGLEHAGLFRDHGWGGGIGLNYFVTRNFGLGLDAAWLSARETPYIGASRTEVQSYTASLIYRYPMDSLCLAPYVFAGGGVAVDGKQWATAHGGVGVEYRVLPGRLGIFADGRWTYLGDRFGRGDLNNASVRMGVRVVF